MIRCKAAAKLIPSDVCTIIGIGEGQLGDGHWAGVGDADSKADGLTRAQWLWGVECFSNLIFTILGHASRIQDHAIHAGSITKHAVGENQSRPQGWYCAIIGSHLDNL